MRLPLSTMMATVAPGDDAVKTSVLTVKETSLARTTVLLELGRAHNGCQPKTHATGVGLRPLSNARAAGSFTGVITP